MKRTTKQPRKALGISAKLGLLAAVSGLALGGGVNQLVAQSAGSSANSGGYSTAGIPTAAEIHGVTSPTAPIQPIGVGPAATGPGATAVESTAVGAPVRRGKWTTTWTPFVEGTVTYSDNINLDSDGLEEDETVLTATAGVTFAAQSERIAGQISYAASYDTFLNDTNEDGFRHNLNTNWSAAVIPNLLYLDAAGGISEVYVDNDDRFSGNPTANSDDRSRAYYGLLSPSLRRNLGGWANAELRYTVRAEKFEDDDLDGGYSQTLSAGITGDPRKFRRFGWQVVSEYEDYTPDEDDDRDLTRWSSYVSVDVPVSRTLAVTGTAGYDVFGDDVGDSKYDGAFANAGLRWQPNVRMAARAFAGYRYDGFDYGAEASYALRQNLIAGLSARRAVQFSDFGDGTTSVVAAGTDSRGRPQFVTPNGDLTANLDEALATNLLTGETGRFGDVDFSPQDETAIVDTLTAYLSGQTGRTGYGFSVTGLQRDYDTVGDDETVISASLGVNRALTPRLGLELGAGYSAVDLDDSDEDDFQVLSLGAGLEYQLTEIVNVFGRYTYTQRFADNADNEFKENAGVVGVRASF